MEITTAGPIRRLPGIAVWLSERKSVLASSRLRIGLALGCLAAGAFAAGLPAHTAEIDPDLVRLMRFMALLKGVFLAIALVGSFWRLARPASALRTAVYLGGPALMAFGTVALWRLQVTGLAAAALHIGMVALAAAALTDKDFIPLAKDPS